MVERSDKMYGGTCINIGCIPTKILVHQAKLAKDKGDFSFRDKQEYYRYSIEKKREVVTSLREKNYYKLADKENIDIYNGEGSFAGLNVVTVKNGLETIQLGADKIFINTGSETIIPSIEGVGDSKFVYTSTSIMELEKLPQYLVIIGAGYIGLEFASMYASFGSKVIVLEGGAKLIPREDRDMAFSVQEALESQGVSFRMNVKVLSIKDVAGGTRISYLDTENNQILELETDAILLATGRKPNTQALCLEKAGIQVNERGAIIVDKYLRTTNPSVWAMGDVKGGFQFTYISLDDYRIIREDLFGNNCPSMDDREVVSYSVFINPPLSHVGLHEEEARKMNLDITVKKMPVAVIPRANTLGENKGVLKAIIDNQTRKIIGCTLFAPESSEVINLIAISMKAEQDYTFLRDFIFTHPSMSEALNDLFS